MFRRLNKTKIVAGVIVALMAAWLWPHYQAQIPRTEREVERAVVAEIAEVPIHAPLSLITQPDDGTTSIEKAIAEATTSIELVIYELEDPHVEQLLVEAQQRGVAVRVILQDINTFGKHPNQEAYNFLKTHNVPVMWAREYFALTHQKTLIIDGSEAIIMTFNFTPQYYPTSRDFGIIDHDPTDIRAIANVFDADWDGRQIHADTAKDLVWSPGSANTLLALIKSANKTLDIYSLEVEDGRINNALKEAASRGVTVRLNMTYSTSWKKALTDLDAHGIQVKTFPSTATHFFIHAKGIIADGQRMFIGSENFSGQSLDSNRELGILVSKPDIISSVQKTFEKDWAASRPYGQSILGATTSGGAAVPSGVIKKSKSGICHPPGSGSYSQTKNFTPYSTLEECLASGGRLPANYGK